MKYLITVLLVSAASGVAGCGRNDDQENQKTQALGEQGSPSGEKQSPKTQSPAQEATSLPGVVGSYRFLSVSGQLVSQESQESFYVFSVDAFHFADGGALVVVSARNNLGMMIQSTFSAKANQKTSADFVGKFQSGAKIRYSYDPRTMMFGADYNLTGTDIQIQLQAVL